MEIYDRAGRLVARLVDELREPGLYRAPRTGVDTAGRRVLSGVYFARLLRIPQEEASFLRGPWPPVLRVVAALRLILRQPFESRANPSRHPSGQRIASIPAIMSRRPRIFLVEEDPLDLKIMRQILENHYELAVANSGEQCLELAQVVPPSLVLLNVDLPGMDGYETCRRLREDPQTRYVKVILVSKSFELQDRLEGYESQADDYMAKPFDKEELLAKIRGILRLRYAEEMEEFKGQFLNLLSHETRTPLTGILSPARLLRDSEDLPSEMREEMTQLIIENAETLQRLVQRAADLCAFKAGRAALEETKVDLIALAEGLARDLQRQAKAKSIHFEIQSSSSPWVMGDAEKLMVALRTIMGNAVEHGYPDSIVQVRISEGRYGAEIQVENHGEVVDEQQMPYVFDAFRVQDVDHHGKGVGVDLALAREIARAHGGELDCRFGTGETMVFRLWLPQDEANHPECVGSAAVRIS